MIIKENIFKRKSKDDIIDIYMKKYHERFFEITGSINKKIFFANDIYINSNNDNYYIELKVLSNNGEWIGTNDIKMLNFNKIYKEIKLDYTINNLEKEKEFINIKIKALKKIKKT